MCLDPHSRDSEPGLGPNIPTCFTSLEEAQNSLYFHRNKCLRAVSASERAFSNEISVTLPDNPNVFGKHYSNYILLRDTFAKWTSAFQAFLDRHSGTLDSKSLQAAAMLKINQLITTLSLETFKEATSDGSWDQYLSVCAEIVDLATTIVKIQEASSVSLAPKADTISLDVSTVAPLYTVVHRCRDPKLRRRAIALLYSTRRQEGLWGSIVTARVCERIMFIEEAGLGEVKSSADIPHRARVKEVDVRFDMQGRRAYLSLSRRSSKSQAQGFDINTFHETIEW